MVETILILSLKIMTETYFLELTHDADNVLFPEAKISGSAASAVHLDN